MTTITNEFSRLNPNEKDIIFDSLINLVTLAKEELEGFQTFNTDVADKYLKMEALIQDKKEIDDYLSTGTSECWQSDKMTSASLKIEIAKCKVEIKKLCEERKPFLKNISNYLDDAHKLGMDPKKYRKA